MRVPVLLPILISVASPVLAQAPAALMACARIPGDTERLACFDAEMAKTSPEARAALEKRTADAAVAAKARAEAEAVAAKARAEAELASKSDAFGAEAITSRADRFAPPEGELQTIETKISEVLTNTSGLAVFMLENGMIWRQVDPSRLPRVRPGDEITVTRANFGGYHLNFLRTKNWALVKRVR
jgi:hypothetical protein